MGQSSATGRAADTSRGSICGGLGLLRIAESIKGPRTSTIPDSSFSYNRLDGLLDLFDFLLDSDVKMGAICVNDVRLGKPESDKIIQLFKRCFARGTSAMRVCS